MPRTKTAPAVAVEPTQLLTAAEVMDRLRISRRTLERMIAENQLPPDYRVRRTYRWTANTVEAFIEANRASANG